MTVEEVKAFSCPLCVIVEKDTEEWETANADRKCCSVVCHCV